MAELVVRDAVMTADDGTTLAGPVDLRLVSGELVMLVGPNGAGKSSLVRALAGIAPHSGDILLDGQPVGAMPPLVRARLLAWLPQALPPAWPVSVRDAVALGRFAYGAAPGRLAPADAAAIDTAMVACDVAALARRRITTLSGGELARVHLARLLATETPVVLADEPAAALDLAHRWDMLRLLRAVAAEGRLVLVVAHDLNLAARWADRLVVMAGGRIVADGPPAAILTETLLASVFGVTARIDLSEGHPGFAVTGTVSGAVAAERD